MNKKIFVLLLILMTMLSIAGVSAVEIADETSDANQSIDVSTDNVLSDNDYGADEEYDEPDGYVVAFFDNRSIVNLTYDEINWDVKNLTESEDYWVDTFEIYLSTFEINGVEYTICREIPTSGVFGDSIFISFNPNEFDVYGEIFYKTNNGVITDIIGHEGYRIFDETYYRIVGIGSNYYYDDDYSQDDFMVNVNNECYKIIEYPSEQFIGFFNKSTEGIDYKVVDGEFYTLDDEKISHLFDVEDLNQTVEFINGTYFITDHYDDENTTYAEAIVNATYLMSDDGFYYDSHSDRFSISPYDYIRLNNTFYRVIYGESTNKTVAEGYIYDTDSMDKYALIDGKLYPITDNVLGQAINLTTDFGYKIMANDVTKYYDGSERFIITLYDENNKTVAKKDVKITINNQTYTRTTNETGQASIALGLNSGKYGVTTEYNGSKAYSTVTIKDSVISSDFSKIYKNGTQYYGTFIDSQGNLLKNTDVQFNINGVFYTRKTNDSGVARMNINLNAGKYVLTATNPSTNEKHTTTITVLPIIVENENLTKYYKNSSQYTVRLLDDTGKPVGEGVNVTFNINGVFYTRTTNESGYAKININLEAGEYIITAEYKGYRESNKIKVLPVLSADDLYMTYRDGSQFRTKLVDGQGKAYANQNVTFNINGVFYQRLTDENGTAKLNINLMAGKYIITSTYNGCNIANEVLINGEDVFYYGKG